MLFPLLMSSLLAAQEPEATQDADQAPAVPHALHAACEREPERCAELADHYLGREPEDPEDVEWGLFALGWACEQGVQPACQRCKEEAGARHTLCPACVPLAHHCLAGDVPACATAAELFDGADERIGWVLDRACHLAGHQPSCQALSLIGWCSELVRRVVRLDMGQVDEGTAWLAAPQQGLALAANGHHLYAFDLRQGDLLPDRLRSDQVPTGWYWMTRSGDGRHIGILASGVAPDGQPMALLEGGQLWRPAAVQPRQPLALEGVIVDAAFASDLQSIYLAACSGLHLAHHHCEDPSLVRCSTQTGAVLQRLALERRVKTLSASQAGLAVAWEGGGAQVYAPDLQPLRSIDTTELSILALSPDGAWLAGMTEQGYRVLTWDEEGGEREVGRGAPGLAYSPDGELLVLTRYNEVLLKDPSGERRLAPPVQIRLHEQTQPPRFSADGSWLVVGDNERTAYALQLGQAVALEAPPVWPGSLRPMPEEETALVGGAIHGQVRLEGAAAPGVDVVLGQGCEVIERTTSDSEGRFRFEGLAGGRWRIGAWREGFGDTWNCELSAAQPEAQAALELVPGPDLQGRVLRPSGKPARRAELVLAEGSWLVREATADRKGRFLFPGVRQRRDYQLLARNKKGEAAVLAIAVKRDAPLPEQEIQLLPADDPRVMRVRILQDTGDPIEEAAVSVDRARFPLDEEGWWLGATEDGSNPKIVPHKARWEQDAGKERLAVLHTAKVVFPQRGADSGWMDARLLNAQGTDLRGYEGDDHCYWEGLQAGRYTFHAKHPDRKLVFHQLELGAGQELELSDEPILGATISGRLVDAVTGAPVRSVVKCSWFIARELEEGREPSVDSGEQVEADSGPNGGFQLTGIAPGTRLVKLGQRYQLVDVPAVDSVIDLGDCPAQSQGRWHGLHVDTTDAGPVVWRVYDSGPAHGLVQKGDLLLSIDEWPVAPLAVGEINALLDVYHPVQLRLRGEDGAERTVTLTPPPPEEAGGD